ncbi:MAG: helix-turn-helix domain-containing protein [Microbacterium arborescens]
MSGPQPGIRAGEWTVRAPRRLSGSSFGSSTVSVHEFPDTASVMPVEPRTDAAVRVHIVERGTIHFSSSTIGRHDGREFSLPRHSGAITLDPFQPPLRTVRGSRLLTASVPSVLVRDIPLDPMRLHVVPPASALLAPAAAFLRSAAAAPPNSRFTEYFFDRLLQEIALGLVVEAAGMAPDTGGRRNPMVFAMAVIAAQCADPELTAAAVAREVSISQRQLERLFRVRGTSIGHQIRRARVDLAVSMLRDPTHRALTVDQIAAHAGFSNGSSLARAMRSEGTDTPSSMRPRPRAIPTPTRPAP